MDKTNGDMNTFADGAEIPSGYTLKKMAGERSVGAPLREVGPIKKHRQWTGKVFLVLAITVGAIGLLWSYMRPVEGEDREIEDIGLELAWVAPGSFKMGSDDGPSIEKPAWTVQITREYWMGRTEVTNGQYQEFLKESGYDGSKDADGDYMFQLKEGYRLPTGNEYPMTFVGYKNAVAFCHWLTDRERKAGRLPVGYEYRLPTEAEWEYAAQGGAKTHGFTYAGSNDIDEVAWYYRNSKFNPHEVSKLKPNELGLYDMSGNVREWCHDWHQVGYSGRKVNVDPQGPLTGKYRIFRGGYYNDKAALCRVTSRANGTPTDAQGDRGFRVCLGPLLLASDAQAAVSFRLRGQVSLNNK